MTQIAIACAGGEEFGIEIGKVVEILKSQRIYVLPQLPSFLSGIVNVRGEVIPLLDLRKRFGIVPASDRERIVVVRSGSEKVGLLVDDVKDIVALENEEIVKPHSMFRGLKSEYLTGIGKKGESIIILLNLDTLLSSEEKLQLQEARRIGDANAGPGTTS